MHSYIHTGATPGQGARRTSLTEASSQFLRLVRGGTHRPAAGVPVVGAELEGSRVGLPWATVPPVVHAPRILAWDDHITTLTCEAGHLMRTRKQAVRAKGGALPSSAVWLAFRLPALDVKSPCLCQRHLGHWRRFPRTAVAD